MGGRDPQPASNGRTSQPSLIPVAAVRLSEVEQIVYDWGVWNGYPEMTEDDARQIHREVRKRYPGKPSGYFRKIASPEGGGFGSFFEDHRTRRNEGVEEALKRLRESEPECEHGTLAGKAPHPTQGSPLCPMCRSGRAPSATRGPESQPAVAAAVDAYREAYVPDPEDEPRIAARLLAVAQQAAALAARGMSIDQLTALAHAAGRARTSLFVAATTERTPA